ncbi:MAG: TrkH family potassium uptake protein [Thermodesulfobacteriota bacterium]
MAPSKFFAPLALPIHAFALAILAGGAALGSGMSSDGKPVRFLDALFTATSATCVTGLTVVDTSTAFNTTGQAIILALFQLGGLGIMTYTSLVFILWRRRVSMTDFEAVGESLLHDPRFKLGGFLGRMVLMVFLTELAGALALHLMDPAGFPPFSALFHAVSAFCNAGFALFPDNLTRYAAHPGVNLVVMGLIILGGLGFSTLHETHHRLKGLLRPRCPGPRPALSLHARIVLSTSAFLIVAGAAGIHLGEHAAGGPEADLANKALAALFQSVSCRTAGFNTVDIGAMTNLSLTVMLFLMFVGGSPASCAGGIKTTTFRVMVSFAAAQLMGRNQTVVQGMAVEPRTLNKALTLAIFGMTIVSAATLALCVTETPHHSPGSRALFLDSLFEVVSAFGTVGLSTGLTPNLSDAGKVVIMLVMFIGRIGPIAFLSFLQALQEPPRYRWPEEGMLIG